MEFSFRPNLAPSLTTFPNISVISFSDFVVTVVSHVYLKSLICLTPIDTPHFMFSSTACITCSPYTLNRYGDRIQPCQMPFLMWNLWECFLLHYILAVCCAYRFFNRWGRWDGKPILFMVSQRRLWLTQLNAFVKLMKNALYLRSFHLSFVSDILCLLFDHTFCGLFDNPPVPWKSPILDRPVFFLRCKIDTCLH